MMYAAIDTGTTRNATVLVVGEGRATSDHPGDRPLWVITGLWRWQGRPGAPLDHRLVVGPAVGRLLQERRISVLAADGIESAGLSLALTPMGVRLRIQGGDLGPSPDGKTIGVYGHGRVVVQERRLKIEIDDADEIDRLVRGFAAIQCEAGRVWLPEEGADHHDSTSAVLRLLWHAKAGETLEEFDPKAWEELNAAFRSRRAPVPTEPARPGDDPDLFRHPRAR